MELDNFLSVCLYCIIRFPYPFLLKVIAATVASNPEKYSDAFLGKTNEAYCAWILNSEKWGGLSTVSHRV